MGKENHIFANEEYKNYISELISENKKLQLEVEHLQQEKKRLESTINGSDTSEYKDVGNELEKSTELCKQSEIILHASFKNFKDITIYSIDKNYCYLYFNETHKLLMENLYNRKIEIGKNILDCITNSEDRNKAKVNFDLAFLGESLSTTDEYGKNQKTYFDFTFGPIHNSENEIIGATVFAQDSTDKVRREKELEYEKELAQQYLNLAGTIIIVFDKNGIIKLVNQKGCNVLGMDEKDIIGKNWFDNFIPKEIVKEVKTVFNNVLSGYSEPSKYYENILISSSSENRIVAWENNILYDSNGEITGVISSGEDVTDIRKKDAELNYLSYHDQLTGLYNRRFFEEQIKRLDNPRNLPLSIIIGDVNGLKLTNDAFGHKAGDQLLKLIGNIISTSIRGNDIATRWGGDEFAILLPTSGKAAAENLIKRIQRKISNAFFECGIVSISFGIGTKKEKDEDINDTFSSAEEIMYENKLKEIDIIRGEAIDTIMNTLFKKSVAEKDHSLRVSELSEKLAMKIGLSKAKINDIKIMGLLHDIGKIVIDLDILEKLGKLSNEEKNTIQQHSLSGSKLLISSHEYSRLAAGVLHHHERIDGKGYPNGIAGDQIPIESKIIAITDSFDAMTAERPYRNVPLSVQEAISELRKNSGTQFDSTIVEVFINKVLLNRK